MGVRGENKFLEMEKNEDEKEGEGEEVASSRNGRANCYVVEFTERFSDVGVE